MSLFDQANLAEITHPDFPGERLVACRNSALFFPPTAPTHAWRCWQRLSPSSPRSPQQYRPGGWPAAGKIGVRVGKVVGRHKMGQDYTLDITDDAFTYTHDQANIDTETALDGIYVVRTAVPAPDLATDQVVATYKSTARVERDFRSIWAIDLDLGPFDHWTETRVRAQVIICMLAAYLVWHLRKTWAPLTLTDESRPEPADPIAPAKRSTAAATKATTCTEPSSEPVRSFRALLDHPGTLTRVDIRYGTGPNLPTVPTLTTPTPTQRRAFELLCQPIPLTLK